MRAFFSALRRFLQRLTAPIRWLVTLVWGLIGPPMRALGRVLDRIFDVFEWLVHKVLDLWNRVWKSGRYPEKVRDEYIGVNGVPLLATLTLFGLWYVLPLARLLEIDETRFILVGAAIWIAAVIAWRSRCREDRRGAGARWAQTVAVTCGLRRLDQIGLLLAGTMCWLARSEAQLWPLAIACVVTFVALLIQDHEPRQTLKVSVSYTHLTLPTNREV